MNSHESSGGPLIGRVGVRLVALDLIAGGLSLPLSALARHYLGGVSIELEIARLPLWIGAAVAAFLWVASLRIVDPGYPSVRIPVKRVLAAVSVWALAASGAMYLLDKNLESRLLIFIAGIEVFSSAILLRRFIHEVSAVGHVESLPQLSAASERALSRGEPISIDLSRIGAILTRPTVIFESGRIWIYPSALSPSERLFKRAFDVLFACAILVVAAMPMLIIALAILIFDGRPILYRDRRAGLFGRPYLMRKFRSMRRGADRERAALWDSSSTSGPAFKLANDPRVTGIGRLLRRFSLDELPQLLDVLAGTMSLVGPRPAGLDEIARYEDRHHLRLTVRPGVTGLWQIRRRIDADFEQRMQDDLEYIRRWSPLLDMAIIVRSIGVMVSGRGV